MGKMWTGMPLIRPDGYFDNSVDSKGYRRNIHKGLTLKEYVAALPAGIDQIVEAVHLSKAE
jgi:hypothetical protein